MSRLPRSRCLMGLGIALVVTGVVLIHSIGPFLILAGLGALAAGGGLVRRGGR